MKTATVIKEGFGFRIEYQWDNIKRWSKRWFTLRGLRRSKEYTFPTGYTIIDNL